MKPDDILTEQPPAQPDEQAGPVLSARLGDSIDTLVEYLVDNDVGGIHPLIMGEIEKRLIIRVLERSRGNKLRAAKLLGMSRNTFYRKLQRMFEPSDTNRHDGQA